MSTQDAFEKWCKDVGQNVYMELAPKDLCLEAWKASQAHNDAVIAELVEALEQAITTVHLSCVIHRIDVQIGKISQPQYDVQSLYEYDKKLLDKIESLIAKHKGQS